jgi:ferredoxin
MRATARVDRHLCLGTGLCEVMGADLFRLTDEGIAVAQSIRDDQAGHLERLQDIAACCPAGAITVSTTED